MTKFIKVINNCDWESDIDENNIDHGKFVHHAKDFTAEEIISADQLLKVYKHHDKDENKIVYVVRWHTVRDGDTTRDFMEMFNSTLERDLKFDSIAEKLCK